MWRPNEPVEADVSDLPGIDPHRGAQPSPFAGLSLIFVTSFVGFHFCRGSNKVSRHARATLGNARTTISDRRGRDAGVHPILFAVERKMIADCPYNSMWIDLLIGTTERLEINQKRILCSGTTLGTLSSICGYLDRFTQKADRYLRVLNGIGIDQGIYNLLIHLRGVFSAINNDEYVFPTLGYAPIASWSTGKRRRWCASMGPSGAAP